MADLQSPRFQGIQVLDDCLNGRHRMMSPETGIGVERVQQALIDLGYGIPSGATGNFLGETSAAVVEFKREHQLVPGDPVVGPGTMGALDEDIVAYDKNLVAPHPPPVPPVPVDRFGRLPAGVAKVPAGLATAGALAAGGGAGAWPRLSRGLVAAGITSLVGHPDLAQQGGNGLCTTAAFINVWAQDAPDSYAAFATALFENGAADLAPRQGAGGLRITASADLRNADYTAIATRMAAKNYPVPSQADWMVMSAIRDSSNSVFDFTGDPDDWVSHALGDGSMPFGELTDWLRAAGRWASVVNEESAFVGPGINHALGLDGNRARIILSIDVGMFGQPPGGHSVVLRSPVTRTGDTVECTVWTWTQLKKVSCSVAQFESNYKGASLAFI